MLFVCIHQAAARASAAAVQSPPRQGFTEAETATLATSLASVNTTAFSTALVAAQITKQRRLSSPKMLPSLLPYGGIESE